MGTVVGTWRLKLILILVIFSTCVYTANAVFGDLGGNVDENGYFNYSAGEKPNAYNDSNLGEEKSDSFVDVLLGIGDFLTFATIDNPFARILLNAIMGLVWIVIGYIIFTFVKEWIPLV